MYLIFTIILYLIVPKCFSQESFEVELTDDNFSEKTKSQDWSLVLFHRNWCARSKQVMKEFDKAANFVGNNNALLWAKVDCETDGKKTCEKFSVSTVPLIFLFKASTYFKEFLGKPDYAGIVRFVKVEIGPGYTILNSEEEKEIFFSGKDVKVIGNFKFESDLKKTYMGLADQWKNQFDFCLNGPDLEDDEEGIFLLTPAHLQNKFEPAKIKYSGSNDASELEQWLKANKHGLVGHRHKYNHNDFNEPLVVVYYQVDYERASQITHYWRNRVLKVAQSYPDFHFAISATKDFQKEMANFGYNFMRPSATPLVCAYIKNKRYPMNEDFTSEALVKYLNHLKSGKIEPHIRSEEIPTSNDANVKIVVAKNFDDIVTDSGRDAMIKFYAPWCTWCKNLAPIWKDLGKSMESENVDIIKFNAESNEIPSAYEVNGYPTLFWVRKDSKKSPVTYNGGRTLDDFIKYIAKHATDELKGYDRQGVPKRIPEQKTPPEIDAVKNEL